MTLGKSLHFSGHFSHLQNEEPGLVTDNLIVPVLITGFYLFLRQVSLCCPDCLPTPGLKWCSCLILVLILVLSWDDRHVPLPVARHSILEETLEISHSIPFMGKLWCEERKWLVQGTQLFLVTKEALEPGLWARFFHTLVRNPSFSSSFVDCDLEGGPGEGERHFVLLLAVETGHCAEAVPLEWDGPITLLV